jgi:hypothetical protein
MERILCPVKRTQIHIIREKFSRDIINVAPANTPFIRVESVRGVGGSERALCGEQRIVPVSIGVETNPAAEFGT